MYHLFEKGFAAARYLSREQWKTVRMDREIEPVVRQFDRYYHRGVNARPWGTGVKAPVVREMPRPWDGIREIEHLDGLDEG